GTRLDDLHAARLRAQLEGDPDLRPDAATPGPAVMFDSSANLRHLRHRGVHPRHVVSDRTALRLGIFAIVVVIVTALFTTSANATRIKEVAAVQGVRANQLVGYGLVIGLDGTG